VPNGKWDRNQQWRKASLMPNSSQKFQIRVDARAAELKDCCIRLGSAHNSSNRDGDIIDVDRLQSHQAAAEHRIDRKLAKEPEDGGKKRVIRSEHHRRANDKCIIERGTDRQFAFTAFSNIEGRRDGISADSRNVNKPGDSSPACLSCYPLGRLDVNGVESFLSSLDVKADRIYDAVSAGKRVCD
jgi:hypothetical protein